MFRRKEDGTEELITEAEAAAMNAPTTPTPAAPAAMASAPAAQPAAPAFRPVPTQAAMAAARPPMAPAASPAAAPEPARAATPLQRPSAKRILTVGPDIQMKGEITSCDRVVIEGMVDAAMRDVHTVELAETGSLKGTAEVEDAEISGSFEGDLVVRGKLTIHASGRVRGNITYGEVEISRGGQISGNIRTSIDAKNAAQSVPGKKAA